MTYYVSSGTLNPTQWLSCLLRTTCKKFCQNRSGFVEDITENILVCFFRFAVYVWSRVYVIDRCIFSTLLRETSTMTYRTTLPRSWTLCWQSPTSTQSWLKTFHHSMTTTSVQVSMTPVLLPGVYSSWKYWKSTWIWYPYWKYWKTAFPSARQHASYGDCLEVKVEYYQNSCVLDCVTQCSQSATHLREQFLHVQQIGFVHWDPYAVCRGGCLELYYYNVVEWFWWDSSLIFDDQLVSFSALTLLVWSSGL